ncbi:MAG TPA: helix-turn-helix transcriptional regulator [Clostridia bacterium]|jgi:transcriptional regulator with XRE-family HTH domain|nr:helix-turn-helix transcriptional regulator [Clostridiaceae bacterium]HOF26683.1 helix-turn-helix transcriptional regulator [Clostridia bacterium]HOM35286.1 helix-turn-helix transcriptional regulator [Clostridia bacterium]HOR89805.1 helix-turn-helix transcriptional regulator [Clostridia bacterium]HOT71598.1 helix-turn-helix transcriptional regulator [Clostridia bacterium]
MIDYKYIGQRIKEKRKSLNLTQHQLSQISQISAAYISRIEAGLQNMTLDTLEKVARSIDEDAIYLITGVRYEEDNCIKHICNNTSTEFVYLLEQALLELKRQGILNIQL